jgi:hypothetical protein
MDVTPLDRFLDLCCTEIERRARLAETEPVALLDGAAAFRQALDAAPPEPEVAPTTLATVPVAAQLQHLSPTLIGRAAVAAAVEIPWIPSPRLDDGGANVALGIVNEVRDLGDLTCGLILVAPGSAYPEHAHPPQEIYLPISGKGSWRYGGSSEYRTLHDDLLVYNHPRDLHGTVAGDEPLVALYILWP